MLQANFTARSGIIAQQERVDTIANNLANVNTNGYKSVRADFKDALYETMQRPVQPQTDLNLERGSGTMLGATTRSFLPGTMKETDRTLDLFLNGDGFFTLLDSNGNTCYTRDGSFSFSMESDGAYLVNSEGDFLLDDSGAPIYFEGTEENLQVDSAGVVYKITYDTSGNMTSRTEVAKLGIAKFKNRKGLETLGTNKFIASATSGEAEEDTETTVKQGALESSNVDLAVEFTRLIRAQRAFSLASKALTTADEMDAKANDLR